VQLPRVTLEGCAAVERGTNHATTGILEIQLEPGLVVRGTRDATRMRDLAKDGPPRRGPGIEHCSVCASKTCAEGE
jgi:hypothetical protein